MPVPTAVRELMHGLIDYAGLFPPALLPLEEAFDEYASLATDPYVWMLNRFIVPAARLRDLGPLLADTGSNETPFRALVTLGAGGSASRFAEDVRSDLARVRSFLQQTEGRARVAGIETKLPDLAGEGLGEDEVLDLMGPAAQLVEETCGQAVELSFEPVWHNSDGWEDSFRLAASAIERHNGSLGQTQPAGFKLRCGGIDPDMVPDPQIVATAIELTLGHEIPFKATAGLHHPVRMHSESLGGWMHGFLNLFFAAIHASTEGADRDLLLEILNESDPAAFRAEGDVLQLHDMNVHSESIRQARGNYLRGFGSCSFDEPRDDLLELGLLEVSSS